MKNHSHSNSVSLLVVASFGGHWVQLNRLGDFFSNYKTYYSSTIDLSSEFDHFYKVPDINVNSSKFKIFYSIFVSFYYLLKVRPKIIVTTGALPGLVFIVLGKLLFKSKTIWIDSIANGDEISRSGVFARKYSDLWLTQWEHLAHENGPKYLGSVI